MTHADFKILVIEDDPDVMAATSKLLNHEEYRVYEAQTGRQGIEKASGGSSGGLFISDLPVVGYHPLKCF